MKLFSLHPYQREGLKGLLQQLQMGPGTHVALLYCTGAGKTWMGMALCARTLLRDYASVVGPVQFSHVVFAAPTDVIRLSFDTEEHTHFEDDDGVHVVAIEGDELHRKPLLKDPGVKAPPIYEYLCPGQPGYAMRVTHAAVRNIYKFLCTQKDQFPDYTKGKLLFLDEGHHAAADDKGIARDIRNLRDLWLECGGNVITATATPVRDDGWLVLDQEVFGRAVKRTLPDQMAEGMAPSLLRTQILTVDCEGRSDKDSHAVPLDPVATSQTILRNMRMESLGHDYPVKALVRVKSSGGVNSQAENHAIILALATAFQGEGLRVFVATKVHVEADKSLQVWNKKVLDDMRSQPRPISKTSQTGDIAEVRTYEKSIRSLADSCVDVVIGIHAVIEGFDWPQCSHVYFIGIPRGLLPLTQGIGRCMRDRKKFVESQWKDQSKVILVTAKMAKLDDIQARQMLGVCAYLSTFRQWQISTAIRSAFKSFHFETPEAAAQAEAEVAQVVREIQPSQDRCSEVVANEADALAHFLSYVDVSYDRSLSFSDKAKITAMWLHRNDPPVSKEGQEAAEEALAQETADILKTLVFSDKRAERLLQEAVVDELEQGQPPDAAVRRASARIIEKFKEEVSDPDLTPIAASYQELSSALNLREGTIRRYGNEWDVLWGKQATPPTPEPQNSAGTFLDAAARNRRRS